MTILTLLQHISSELALVDVDENKLKGEMMDLQHGMSFAKPCRIRASSGNITIQYIIPITLQIIQLLRAVECVS